MATLEQIEQALRAADAAGNTEDARKLAQAYAAMRSQATSRADFGGVSHGGDTVPANHTPGAHTPLATGQAALAAPGQGTMRLQGAGGQPDMAADAANREQMFNDLPMPLRGAIGVGSAVANMGRGMGQLYAVGADAIAPRSPTMSQLVTGEDPSRMAAMQQAEARARQNDAPIMGDPAGVVGRIGGDAAMFAVPLSKIGTLGKVGQYGASAGAGGVIGAAMPTVEGESRLVNAGVGTLSGLLGQGLGNKLAQYGQRVAKAITPEVRELAAAAKARGIELTPAQLSNSKALKFVQSALSRLPLASAGKGDAQRAAFNRELAKEIGEDADAVTPEVFAAAKRRHSQQFEELTARNNLKVDDDLIRKLGEIEEEARIAGGDVLSSVRAAIDDLYLRSRTGQGGVTIPGKAYQSFDSQIGQLTKLGTPVSHFVGRVRSAVRSAMDDSISPADRAAWKRLRTEYGNRKTIRDLVGKSESGDISPSQLMGRVTANNAGKESMATGTRGSLGELARIGQRLREPASSGTAERIGSLATGAAAITNLPLTLAALLGGRAAQKGIDSSLLARLLMRQGRGQGAQALAPYIRTGGIVGGPVLTQEQLDQERAR